ncbi:MAG: murein peptide amidase A [Planctomycetes bacterium]|nr:murein peptide amidase A [Planctomycetota bacterium]
MRFQNTLRSFTTDFFALMVNHRLCRTRQWFALCLTVALIATTGCGRMKTYAVGMSVQDRPIECHRIGFGRNTVLIVATIHGDESAGTPLVRRLAQEIADNPKLAKGRRVLMLPVVNPDGYVNNSRFNAHGVDLNRNFPSDNFDPTPRHGRVPLCEPESRAIYDLIKKYRPRRIVSIHQPIACIDYDGPAADLAATMGMHTNLPVRRIGSRPGSLGSYAGLTLDTPIVTLELPTTASSMDEESLWDAYGNTLLAAIRFPDELSE